MDTSRNFKLSRRNSSRMSYAVTEGRIHLMAGECWAPRPSHSVTLRCTQGTFWWTQPGDAHDHLLRVGQELTVSAHNGIVLQALTGAELVVAAG